MAMDMVMVMAMVMAMVMVMAVVMVMPVAMATAVVTTTGKVQDGHGHGHGHGHHHPAQPTNAAMRRRRRQHREPTVKSICTTFSEKRQSAPDDSTAFAMNFGALKVGIVVGVVAPPDRKYLVRVPQVDGDAVDTFQLVGDAPPPLHMSGEQGVPSAATTEASTGTAAVAAPGDEAAGAGIGAGAGAGSGADVRTGTHSSGGNSVEKGGYYRHWHARVVPVDLRVLAGIINQHPLDTRKPQHLTIGATIDATQPSFTVISDSWTSRLRATTVDMATVLQSKRGTGTRESKEEAHMGTRMAGVATPPDDTTNAEPDTAATTIWMPRAAFDTLHLPFMDIEVDCAEKNVPPPLGALVVGEVVNWKDSRRGGRKTVKFSRVAPCSVQFACFLAILRHNTKHDPHVLPWVLTDPRLGDLLWILLRMFTDTGDANTKFLQPSVFRAMPNVMQAVAPFGGTMRTPSYGFRLPPQYSSILSLVATVSTSLGRTDILVNYVKACIDGEGSMPRGVDTTRRAWRELEHVVFG